MSNYLPRNHSGYQPLPVPLPAAEDRLYPSLEERDHRVLPPPADASIPVAVQPSAPVVGFVQQAPQARAAFTNAAAPIQYSQPGYVALPNDSQAASPVGASAGGAGQISSASASSQPFISNSVLPPPTISLLEERIKGSSRVQFSLQAMFNYSWRFFTKNFGRFCGAQLCILLLLFLVATLLIALFVWSGASNTFSDFRHHHASRRDYLILLAIEFVIMVLIVLPLFLALTYATIKAIQQNRYLYLDQFFGYFGLHYCNFFGFCFLNSLLLIPLSFLSILGTFIYFVLFSFAMIFKFQFPEMSTFKAWGLSIRISAKNWPKIVLLSLLVILMNLFAFFAFGVGLFITIPLTIAVKIYTYHKLVGLHSITGYNNMEGRSEEYSYDATGLNPDVPMVPQQLQPHQAQYVQLVPMQMPMTMRVGNNGIPMPMMAAMPAPAVMMPHMAPHPAYLSAGAAQNV